MDGCLKSEISAKWMKAMLNWDLYTNPQADEFDKNYTPKNKKELAEDWQHFMEMNNTWISFYSWKDNISPLNVFTGSTNTSANKHAWIALDGAKVETPSTFPLFKGIVIRENQNAAKAIPLVQKRWKCLKHWWKDTEGQWTAKLDKHCIKRPRNKCSKISRSQGTNWQCSSITQWCK